MSIEKSQEVDISAANGKAAGRQIFLHIGLHKTGTTAIQYFFSKNPVLVSQGFFYPSSARPAQEIISYGHHRLSWSLIRNPEDIVSWDNLKVEIEESRAGNVILSSEEFDVLNEEGISRVRSLLSDYDVRIVAYLRRQDEFAQAYYTTDVLFNHETRPLHEYVNSLRTSLDYWKLLSRWAEQFGRDNIIVRVYEKSALFGGDVVKDFCHILGIKSDDSFIMPPSRINHGYPKNVVDIVRSLRMMRIHGHSVISAISIAEKVYRDRKGSFYDLMAPAQAKQFVERFQEGNSRVASEYLNRAKLFEEKAGEDSGEGTWQQLYGRRYGSLCKTIEDLKAYILA
jgi:hypothetical protein